MYRVSLVSFLLFGVIIYAVAGPLSDSHIASKVRGYSSAYTPAYSSPMYSTPYETSYSPTYTTYPWIQPCAQACAGCLYCYQQVSQF